MCTALLHLTGLDKYPAGARGPAGPDLWQDRREAARTKKGAIRVMEISQSRGGNPRDALCK